MVYFRWVDLRVRPDFPTLLRLLGIKKENIMLFKICEKCKTTMSFWTIGGLFVANKALRERPYFLTPLRLNGVEKKNFVVDTIYENCVTKISFWTISGLF